MTYVCPHCHRPFKNKRALSMHKALAHKGAPQVVDPITPVLEALIKQRQELEQTIALLQKYAEWLKMPWS